MEGVTIRPEEATDIKAIYALTVLAFKGMEHSAGDEQDLINLLRDQGALTISLVALIEGEIVGHVAFSPAKHASGAAGWFALGPVSVRPALQKRGIGTALIEYGLKCLREKNAQGAILVGHLTYYPRFGFKLSPSHAPACEPAEYFMVLAFDETIPSGQFSFHNAFYEPSALKG